MSWLGNFKKKEKQQQLDTKCQLQLPKQTQRKFKKQRNKDTFCSVFLVTKQFSWRHKIFVFLEISALSRCYHHMPPAVFAWWKMTWFLKTFHYFLRVEKNYPQHLQTIHKVHDEEQLKMVKWMKLCILGHDEDFVFFIWRYKKQKKQLAEIFASSRIWVRLFTAIIVFRIISWK